MGGRVALEAMAFHAGARPVAGCRSLLAQLSPAPGDAAANARARRRAHRRAPEADLAVFPELFLGRLRPAPAPASCAVDPDGAGARAVRARGARTRHGGRRRLRRARAATDVAQRAALHRRATARSPPSTARRCLFGARGGRLRGAATQLVVVQLAGRRVGAAVCFDVEFPEPARAARGRPAPNCWSPPRRTWSRSTTTTGSRRGARARQPPAAPLRQPGRRRGPACASSAARAVIAPDGTVAAAGAQQGEHVQVDRRRGRRAGTTTSASTTSRSCPTRLPCVRSSTPSTEEEAHDHDVATRRPPPALFTRKATGLVREARTVDALFYNVMWASVALAFAFYWLLYGFLPGLERVRRRS